jgi:hypothetical protein
MDLETPRTRPPDGTARYRIDSTGTRVVIVPATCKQGLHSLTATGYRAISGSDELRLICVACAAVDAETHHWRLTMTGSTPDRAELDDEPYRYAVIIR